MTRDAQKASRYAEREYSVNTADMLCFIGAVAVVEAQPIRGDRPCSYQPS
ncbi:hypothetical protein [Thalassococcus sp. S3]|nr:hypothetical protein [Thalassococcus sp. S3]